MGRLNTDERWDLIVIGGGVTGAGIFLEASKNGIRTLLLEQNDFAWGTSSRSSKLVHGGLRYLKEKQFGLTYESVKEREKLLREAPFLVETVDFMMPVYRDKGPKKISIALGLMIYDFMAMKWRHKFIKAKKVGESAGLLAKDNLKGVFTFEDGRTDDARLVLRLIMEGIKEGNSSAVNYCKVTNIKETDGRFYVSVFNKENLKETVFNSSRVINATGVWCDRIRKLPEKERFIRPLRGSHIVIPKDKIKTQSAIGFSHPDDNRMLFVIPWEGVLLCGTTDIDHSYDRNIEPKITHWEVEYIIKALNVYFPDAKIDKKDIISTFAGVRPVVSRGKIKASSESREYLLWNDNGITSVTGGKLTTFRKIAFDTLRKAGYKSIDQKAELFDKPDILCDLYREIRDKKLVKKLVGRYGSNADKLLCYGKNMELFEKIPGTEYLWVEILYSVEHELVKKLSDLMLRRFRIGNILQGGGIDLLDKIEDITKGYLPWNSERWKMEKEEYIRNWNQCYSIDNL